jgi:choline dehydrogenase
MSAQFDYIIAGGGSAGCVLANRLSEDPRNSVLLLEVGGSSDSLYSNVPAIMLWAIGRMNWFYQAEPDPTVSNRRILWNSGKALGGGSAINGMVYTRGAAHDYDRMAQELGCTGWAWNDVLPYFLKSETFEGKPSQWHGQHGPLSVAPLRAIHPLAHSFVEACTEIGMREIEDYCSGDMDGAYINFATQRRGKRSSTEEAFLKPIRKRPNLHVVTGALVDRVVFEGERAVGLRYTIDGRLEEARARREVVLSSGAVGSPAILMRSGIGPGSHLQEMGIAVQVDAGDVGQNLQEHSSMQNSRLVDSWTYNVRRNPFRLGWEGLNFILRRRGLLTTCAVHAQAHFRSSPELEHPDLKIQMMPFWHDSKSRPYAPKEWNMPDSSRTFGITIGVNIIDPDARGEIRLKSADPVADPIISHKLYDNPSDLSRMRKGMDLINRIYAAPAMARHVRGECYPPDATSMDDAEWERVIQQMSTVGHHPVATCRMGGDGTSVVDTRLRVRGVSGLRVVDASIFPFMPNANTNAVAIMAGEKGAQMMLDDAKQRG